MKLHKVAYVLLIVGGLAWGLEVLNMGLDQYLSATLMSIIYVLVAVSALYELFSHKGLCKACGKN